MRDRYVKKVEDEQRMQESLRAVEKKHLPHMLCVTNMLLHVCAFSVKWRAGVPVSEYTAILGDKIWTAPLL
jgi:hypothetical protein